MNFEILPNFDKNADTDYIIKCNGYCSLLDIENYINKYTDFYCEINTQNDYIEIDGIATVGNQSDLIELEEKLKNIFKI